MLALAVRDPTGAGAGPLASFLVAGDGVEAVTGFGLQLKPIGPLSIVRKRDRAGRRSHGDFTGHWLSPLLFGIVFSLSHS